MNVTPASARRWVLISVFGLLAIAAYRGKLSTTDVSFTKRLWGTGVLAIMLGLVADVAPQIAGPFAVLVLVGSFTNGGDQAIQNLLGKVSGSGGLAGAEATVAAQAHSTPPGVQVPAPKSPGTNP